MTFLRFFQRKNVYAVFLINTAALARCFDNPADASRFNGFFSAHFSRQVEAVKTAAIRLRHFFTPLKQGVNEKTIP
jgi:hypothetical protein